MSGHFFDDLGGEVPDDVDVDDIVPDLGGDPGIDAFDPGWIEPTQDPTEQFGWDLISPLGDGDGDGDSDEYAFDNPDIALGFLGNSEDPPAASDALQIAGPPSATADLTGARAVWAHTLGVSGADPAGLEHTEGFDAPPDELAERAVAPSDGGAGWTDTSVFAEASDDQPVTRSDDAITGLWERLAPGEPLPTTDDGAPDYDAALDELAVRNPGPDFAQIVTAVRSTAAP